MIKRLSRRGFKLLTMDWRSFAAISIKLSGAFVSFLVIFVVARLAGAEVTGEYAMVLATTNIISLCVIGGLDQIMVRAIGGDLAEDRTDRARAVMTSVIRIIAPASILGSLIMVAASPLAPSIGSSQRAMAISAIAVLAFPLLRIGVNMMRATGSMLRTQIFDGLAHSALILTVVLFFAESKNVVTSELLAASYAGSVLITAIVVWTVIAFRIRRWERGAPLPMGLWRDGRPILLSSGMQMLSGWLLLALAGAVLGPASVGAYRVASQFTMIIMLMLTTIETMLNPLFAADFRLKNNASAWRRHRRGSILMLFTAFVPIAVCILFPRQLLGLFGPDFQVATTALVILAGAQLVNILTGPIGGIMIMSGHERLSLNFSIAGFILSILLAVLLVPIFGLVGVAISAGSAIILRNLLAYFKMKQILPKI